MALIRFPYRTSLATPRTFLDDLPERMRQMFEGTLAFEPLTESIGWLPSMEIVEKDDSLLVTAELPGVKKDDVDITLEDGVLTIRGEKKEEKKEEKDEKEGKYHMWERKYGSFQRSFTLPHEVEVDKIDAKFDNGILTVTLPKTAKAKVQGRKIPIGVAK